MRRRSPLFAAEIALGVCLLAIAGAAGWWSAGPDEPPVVVTAPAIGGPFTLTTTDGSTVTERSFRGKITLVYFGYTTCPDACPTELNEIAGALDELGPLAKHVQPLFITVDPQRDTPEVLAAYVKSFDPRILGLTGTPAQISEAAKVYRVYYAPFKSADAPDGYLMDHTSVVYVMNEEGRFVASFTQETPAAQIAERLRKLVAKIS
jgi:protein SCO1